MKLLKNNRLTFTVFKFKGLLQDLNIKPAHCAWVLVWYKRDKVLELQTPRGATYDLVKA
jgi:hypothetical protein